MKRERARISGYNARARGTRAYMLENIYIVYLGFSYIYILDISRLFFGSPKSKFFSTHTHTHTLLSFTHQKRFSYESCARVKFFSLYRPHTRAQIAYQRGDNFHTFLFF